ncbi:transposase [Treponema phagedenis]|uniref:Transposase n=4 Tax=Treponema phagedenis TaxID=162 RepID=A0A5D5BYB3_TREPH|nr:transposase [Treponema phagedenis]NVP22916.1 transposase [Treponema phagedenis]NVP23203.1 transposase [Treponema phagedenis]NVP24661.1 transposase [Treponema phagedenis]NVP25120.1 transposase [Treponema phagedenis]QEJ93906.1 transposase [Treponema phagedenis]
MRRYSQEFKQQALQLSDEIGTKEAAKNLGISYGTLTDWRKTKNRYKASDGAATAKAIVLDERERQLQREIKELKEANEILQGALAFFVKGWKK